MCNIAWKWFGFFASFPLPLSFSSFVLLFPCVFSLQMAVFFLLTIRCPSSAMQQGIFLSRFSTICKYCKMLFFLANVPSSTSLFSSLSFFSRSIYFLVFFLFLLPSIYWNFLPLSIWNIEYICVAFYSDTTWTLAFNLCLKWVFFFVHSTRAICFYHENRNSYATNAILRK